MVEIKSLTIDELKTALKEMGEKPFRAGQIFKWLHEGVESFEEMSNLSKDLRARLAENFLMTVPEVARKQVSRVDGTVKYLWRLRDGNCVESVLMQYHHGNTICISSEVGCAMTPRAAAAAAKRGGKRSGGRSGGRRHRGRKYNHCPPFGRSDGVSGCFFRGRDRFRKDNRGRTGSRTGTGKNDNGGNR